MTKSKYWLEKITLLHVDQLAKPTFRSRYAHTPFGSETEQSEGPMDTVASVLHAPTS